MVIDFHHDVRRAVRNVLGIPKDLNLIEHQSLVPGGVQCVLCYHCLLALVEEGDDGVGIYRKKGGATGFMNKEQVTMVQDPDLAITRPTLYRAMAS